MHSKNGLMLRFKIHGDMLHALLFYLFVIFCCEFLKPFKNSQHVAEPSVGQKIVPGDMLRGDRLSAIRCCAENRCCKLTRVTPPLDDRHQCWQLLRSSACTTQQVPTSTSNSQHCWANKVVTCCVRLNGP